MFIVDIRCTDQSPTDRDKSRQPQRFGSVLSRWCAGWTRLSAGCARLHAGYNGRALAGTGACRRVTGVTLAPPLWGKRHCPNAIIDFRNFCQKSTSIRQITQTTPAKSSTNPTTTDHTTSVIDVYLRFRAVLNVII